MSRIAKKFLRLGVGTDELNARDLPANYTSSGYTPAQVDTEGLDKLSAHLKGIDNALLSGSTVERSMANSPLYRDYSSSPLTGSDTWNELVASVSSQATKIHVFDSSGTPWYLGFGSSGNENAQIVIPPGGDVIELLIPASTRLTAKTVDSTSVNAGTLLISFLT